MSDERKIAVPFTAVMTVEEFVERLSDLDDDTLFEIIKRIDVQCAEWPFTLRVADHFASLRKLHAQERRAIQDAERMRKAMQNVVKRAP